MCVGFQHCLGRILSVIWQPCLWSNEIFLFFAQSYITYLTTCVSLRRFPCSRGSTTWTTPSCWTCFRSSKDWARKRTFTASCRTSEAGSKLHRPALPPGAQQRGRRVVPALAAHTGSADDTCPRPRPRAPLTHQPIVTSATHTTTIVHYYSSRESHLHKCLLINQKNKTKTPNSFFSLTKRENPDLWVDAMQVLRDCGVFFPLCLPNKVPFLNVIFTGKTFLYVKNISRDFQNSTL